MVLCTRFESSKWLCNTHLYSGAKSGYCILQHSKWYKILFSCGSVFCILSSTDTWRFATVVCIHLQWQTCMSLFWISSIRVRWVLTAVISFQNDSSHFKRWVLTYCESRRGYLFSYVLLHLYSTSARQYRKARRYSLERFKRIWLMLPFQGAQHWCSMLMMSWYALLQKWHANKTLLCCWQPQQTKDRRCRRTNCNFARKR